MTEDPGKEGLFSLPTCFDSVTEEMLHVLAHSVSTETIKSAQPSWARQLAAASDIPLAHTQISPLPEFP